MGEQVLWLKCHIIMSGWSFKGRVVVGGGASRERAGGTTSNPTPPHHNDPGNGPGGEGSLLGVGCHSGRRYAPGKKTWQQCRIDGGPPSRESPGKHVLILLNQLEGYKGSKQQRCWEFNELVSWCCSRCSSAASWLPLHPPIAQGSKKHYGCLAAHRTNPAGGYKVSSSESLTAKRRRRIPMEVL